MSYLIGRKTYTAFSSDPILTEILQELPDLPEAIAADKAAKTLAQTTQTPTIDIDAKIADIIASGTVDATTVSDLAAQREKAAATTRELEILQEIQVRAGNTIESAISNGDAILTAIGARLHDLVDQALPHAEKLVGITTANDAIAAGAKTVTAWGALTDARKNYDALRAAQSTVMMHTAEAHWNKTRRFDGDLPTEASDARIANLDDLWPTWRATRPAQGVGGKVDPAGVVRRDLITRARLDRHPWPGDPTAELAWLITHAELWVPTRRQLDTLWTERKDRDLERARELHLEAKANGTTPNADRLTGAVARPY